ncbi:MAG: glycosyltransferase [Myxococcota bacterium]
MRILVVSGFDWADHGNGAVAALRGAAEALSSAGVDVEVEHGNIRLLGNPQTCTEDEAALLARIAERLGTRPRFDWMLVQTGGRLALRLFEVARAYRIPTCYRIGGLYRSVDREGVQQAAFAADRVLVPSCFVAEYYERAWGLKARAVIAPVQNTFLDPDRPAARALVYLSPCVSKGAEFFVRIIEHLLVRKRTIPTEVIEGRGNIACVANTIQHAAQHGFPISIRRGVIDRTTLFRQTRLLVVCSISEPLGRAASEALGYGVPCLVSDRGGLPEVAAARFACLPVGDSDVIRWADAICEVFDNDDWYRRWAQRARRRATYFAPRTLAASWRSALS